MKMLLALILMLFASFAFGAEVAPEASETLDVIAIVLGCLLAISEVLAKIPALKDNCIFDIVVTLLRALGGMFVKK